MDHNIATVSGCAEGDHREIIRVADTLAATVLKPLTVETLSQAKALIGELQRLMPSAMPR